MRSSRDKRVLRLTSSASSFFRREPRADHCVGSRRTHPLASCLRDPARSRRSRLPAVARTTARRGRPGNCPLWPRPKGDPRNPREAESGRSLQDEMRPNGAASGLARYTAPAPPSPPAVGAVSVSSAHLALRADRFSPAGSRSRADPDRFCASGGWRTGGSKCRSSPAWRKRWRPQGTLSVRLPSIASRCGSSRRLAGVAVQQPTKPRPALDGPGAPVVIARHCDWPDDVPAEPLGPAAWRGAGRAWAKVLVGANPQQLGG